MAKVLVLYYSTYGHVEQMAYAVAEGAREAGADVVVKRVPELVPEEVARQSHFKLDQAAPVATVDELVRLRRDHLRHADPLRQHGLADEAVHRPDRWALDEGCAGRQGRLGLHLDSVSAWRPGDDPDELPHGAVPPRHGGGRIALQLPGAGRGRGGEGRHALRRQHDRGWRRLAPAERAWSWRAPASRAATSPGSPPSWPEAFCAKKKGSDCSEPERKKAIGG